MLLDYAGLDDLLAAVHFRKTDPSSHFQSAVIGRIGPLIELLLHARRRTIDARSIPAAQIVACVRNLISKTRPGQGVFGSDSHSQFGFILTARDARDGDDTHWHLFCHRAQQAAEASGLPTPTAHQLIGAMREMEDNVHLHSERAQDGIVGFRCIPDEFEFVVADSGIGALKSLRQHEDYAELNDAGRALELVLSDGESRFGRQSGHGRGFRNLFTGLADLNGLLRFRTEDSALTMDGTSPSLMRSNLDQKPPLCGCFLASVVCSRTPISV